MTSLSTPVKRARPTKVNVVSPEPKKELTCSEDEEPSPKKVQKLSFTEAAKLGERTDIEEQNPQTTEVSKEVREVYKIIQRSTGAVGGNGYNGAIYGELTAGSMQKVIDYLESSCGLNTSSRFIDVGAGLGKPNFHVLQHPKVALSIGVELEEIRWILSIHNLKAYLARLSKKEVDLHHNHSVNFIHADIDEAETLDPFTHIYMYDLGFPPPLQQSIAEKFNQSVHCRYLISYRPPRRVIKEYGYNVEHLHQMNTKMFGSGESHMAYFYRRVGKIPKDSTQQKIPLTIDDDPMDCYCDDRFIEAIQKTKNFHELKQMADRVVHDHLNSARATRRSKDIISV